MNKLGAIESENEDEDEKDEEEIQKVEEIQEIQEKDEHNLNLEIEKPPDVTIVQVKIKSKIHSLKAERFIES